MHTQVKHRGPGRRVYSLATPMPGRVERAYIIRCIQLLLIGLKRVEMASFQIVIVILCHLFLSLSFSFTPSRYSNNRGLMILINFLGPEYGKLLAWKYIWEYNININY